MTRVTITIDADEGGAVVTQPTGPDNWSMDRKVYRDQLDEWRDFAGQVVTLVDAGRPVDLNGVLESLRSLRADTTAVLSATE